MQNSRVILPTSQRVPILLSVPHAGTAIPDELKAYIKPHLLAQLDDTDWFVDKLYDFAPSMGITMIVANYSRWVIDLNRNPDNTPLYQDGRIITDIVPATNFLGEDLYMVQKPDIAEINRRIALYFNPYHQQISHTLQDLQAEFGNVLLYDAHSIRKSVPSIQANPFPDLILGDNEGKSAHPLLIESILESLEGSFWEVSHNFPFKGGYITRHYGNPSQKIHALQLERAKNLYMDDSETQWDESRANRLRRVLQHTFLRLIEALEEINTLG